LNAVNEISQGELVITDIDSDAAVDWGSYQELYDESTTFDMDCKINGKPETFVIDLEDADEPHAIFSVILKKLKNIEISGSFLIIASTGGIESDECPAILCYFPLAVAEKIKAEIEYEEISVESEDATE